MRQLTAANQRDGSNCDLAAYPRRVRSSQPTLDGGARQLRAPGSLVRRKGSKSPVNRTVASSSTTLLRVANCGSGAPVSVPGPTARFMNSRAMAEANSLAVSAASAGQRNARGGNCGPPVPRMSISPGRDRGCGTLSQINGMATGRRNMRRSYQRSNHAAHEIHLVAVGSAFRRLGSISPPH
jgi:hypothetical protein